MPDFKITGTNVIIERVDRIDMRRDLTKIPILTTTELVASELERIEEAEAARVAARYERCEAIARQTMGIETIATRNSDRLDFHDVGVANVRAALFAAFEAGREAARRG